MAYVKIPAATNRTVDFTSSGTWTCPGGVYSAEFLVVGAGGGGGGADNSVNTRSAMGGGGGGGGVIKEIWPTIPGSTYTITVGAKGTGGNATAGTSGGYSEVVLSGTTLIKAFGGAGAGGVNDTDTLVYPNYGTFAGGSGTPLTGTDSSSQSGGGGAGVKVIGTSNSASDSPSGTQGVDGNNANTGNTNEDVLGLSSTCLFSSGGYGAITDNGGVQFYRQTRFIQNFGIGTLAIATSAGAVNGGSATYYGCGGGGGVSMLSTDAATGGDGADGLVRITYFA